MRTTTRSHHRRHRRDALTVVEVLVALILVSIGLLAIAGSTTLALRTTLDSAHRREAAQRIASRFAQLEAAGCSAATGGMVTDASRSLTEQWLITSRVNGLATITD